ncbi:MAG: hypothetical protein U9Q12_04575 [Patescibacteria group bacterium]|nr:hypothetical protein [Patescibacteria group bacterium]
MTFDDKNNNEKDNIQERVTRFYIVLIVVSVIVMIVAAYITYGYQARTIVISFDSIIEKIKEKKNIDNNMLVSADLSRVPNNEEIEDILNDTIPNVCDDITDDEEIQEKCDKEPLSCLKEYEIKTIIVQNPPHQDHLFIELTTGKNNDHLYTVVIDLANNNQVIHAEGKINEDRCRDVVEEDGDVIVDDTFLKEGQDPKSSDYVNVQPKE